MCSLEISKGAVCGISQSHLTTELYFFFLILFWIEGVHVQCCYLSMLHDALVWGTHAPITQVRSIVPSS